MKTSALLLLAVTTAMLPAITFAAKAGKATKRPSAHATSNPIEVIKLYDKNANEQIDAEELPLLQKAFSALRGLDKNTDGQIDQREADSLKPATKSRKRAHGSGELRKADKNGNRKIDSDEVAGLQTLIAGKPMLSKIDRNSNGRLDADEVERLNKRFEHGGRQRGSSSKPSPAPGKTPAASAAPRVDTPKAEGKGNTDPFLPGQSPSGN